MGEIEECGIFAYALDYSGNFADIVAAGIFVSFWWGPNTSYFGDRCHRDRSQARHRSRVVAV